MAAGTGNKAVAGNMLQGRGGAGTQTTQLIRSPRPQMLSNDQSDKTSPTGNYAARSPILAPADDFKTPTIKSDLYTTGRGGTGNMALNLHSHPELARASQDVSAVPVLGREPENSVHYGRGGAANVAHMSKEAKAGARARNASRRRSEATGQVGQLGKELREQQEAQDKAAAAAAAGGDKAGEGKSKGIFAKLTRALSSNGSS